MRILPKKRRKGEGSFQPLPRRIERMAARAGGVQLYAAPLRSRGRRNGPWVHFSSTPVCLTAKAAELHARVLGRSYGPLRMERLGVPLFSCSTRADRSRRSYVCAASDELGYGLRRAKGLSPSALPACCRRGIRGEGKFRRSAGRAMFPGPACR